MGQMTRAAIIAQGLSEAGRAELADNSATTTAFLAWLRSMAARFPWPRLHKRSTGVALGAGVQYLDFGDGSVVSTGVLRVRDPLHVYRTGFTDQGPVRVQTLDGEGPDESTTDPATSRARPRWVKCYLNGSTTAWRLWFQPVPDLDYLLVIPYLELPADPATGAIPWYPNDRTMIQWVYDYATKYGHQDRAESSAELNALIVRDMVDFGQPPGYNQMRPPLDTRYFR